PPRPQRPAPPPPPPAHPPPRPPPSAPQRAGPTVFGPANARRTPGRTARRRAARPLPGGRSPLARAPDGCRPSEAWSRALAASGASRPGAAGPGRGTRAGASAGPFAIVAASRSLGRRRGLRVALLLLGLGLGRRRRLLDHHGVGDDRDRRVAVPVAVAEGGEADSLSDPPLDLASHVGVLGQELGRVLPALAELVALVGEPGAALLHDLQVHAAVEEAPLLGDALSVDDVELALPERRGDLVLHHLHP